MDDDRCLFYCKKERENCRKTWAPDYCNQFTNCFLSYPITIEILKDLFPFFVTTKGISVSELEKLSILETPINKEIFTNCFVTVLINIISSSPMFQDSKGEVGGQMAEDMIKRLTQIFGKIYSILINNRIELIGNIKQFVDDLMENLFTGVFGKFPPIPAPLVKTMAKKKGLYNVIENFLTKLITVYIQNFSSELDTKFGPNYWFDPTTDFESDDMGINPYELYPPEIAEVYYDMTHYPLMTLGDSKYKKNLSKHGFKIIKSLPGEESLMDSISKPNLSLREAQRIIYSHVLPPPTDMSAGGGGLSFNRKSRRKNKKFSRSRRRSRKSEPASVQKTPYFYKERDGSFKPIYAHKYMKDFKASGRKSYFLNKKGPNPSSQTFHGKFYTKSEITKKSRK